MPDPENQAAFNALGGQLASIDETIASLEGARSCLAASRGGLADAFDRLKHAKQTVTASSLLLGNKAKGQFEGNCATVVMTELKAARTAIDDRRAVIDALLSGTDQQIRRIEEKASELNTKKSSISYQMRLL